MKFAMVAQPHDERHLRTLKQIGVDHVVHYDMNDLPDSLEEIERYHRRYAAFGLDWAIAEQGPAIDRIVLGKEGWEAQTERYKRILGHLGKVGVTIVAYNFMPQVSEDAMVVRTNLDVATRGEARTSRFRRAEVGPQTLVHNEAPIARAAMWENLERFLAAVLPAAEAAGVRLALHPDDPPLSPLCGLERIADSVASFERVLALSPSRSNALTFCVGCFAELGVDVVDLIGVFAERIPYVHVRNIRGTPDDFVETFPDDGQVDLPALFGRLYDLAFDGYLRVDHAPQLAIDPGGGAAGYGLPGHIFSLGYLRGLEHGVRRERARAARPSSPASP
jgi:mannonate dehydratase